MSMQEILDGITGIGDRLDGQDRRFKRMDDELGIDTTGEPKPSDPDATDEENVDTPDAERSMTRGQMRAAARDKDRTAPERTLRRQAHRTQSRPQP